MLLFLMELMNLSRSPPWPTFLKFFVSWRKPQTFSLCGFRQLGHPFWASVPLKIEKAIAWVFGLPSASHFSVCLEIFVIKSRAPKKH